MKHILIALILGASLITGMTLLTGQPPQAQLKPDVTLDDILNLTERLALAERRIKLLEDRESTIINLNSKHVTMFTRDGQFSVQAQ